MRKSHGRDPQGAVGINITPLVDMVFILLIFFIATSSFVKETGVEVNRPRARTAVTQEQANILIAVTKNDEIWINKVRVDIRSLRRHVERLHAENPEAAAVIIADRDAHAGIVVQALDQARLGGVENVAVAAAKAAQ
jgi:biopolymer transport protein ExbD